MFFGQLGEFRSRLFQLLLVLLTARLVRCGQFVLQRGLQQFRPEPSDAQIVSSRYQLFFLRLFLFQRDAFLLNDLFGRHRLIQGCGD